MMRKIAIAALIALSVGPALAQTPPAATPTRIRGTVDKLNGQNLMVKSRDGQTLSIELAANVAVITLVKSEPCQKAKGRREMLEVSSIQAQARASRIACQMRSLVAGMSRLLTPSGASAPTTALTIAGSAPTVPASPAPLAPSGLRLVGTGLEVISMYGIVSARGMQ